MSLFFFHVHDGRRVADTVGSELPDRESARQEAAVFASELIRDRLRRPTKHDDWFMEVSDADGVVLFRLDFAFDMTSFTPASGRMQ